MPMRRIFAICSSMVLMTAIVVWPSSSGEAYVLQGCKWSTNVLHYGNVNGYGLAAPDAAAYWTNTPTSIWLIQSSSPENPDNDIFIHRWNLGPSGYDGITFTYPQFTSCPNSGQTFVSADSQWNTYYAAGYTGTQRVQLMVHELGHALGLAHAGTANCAMQPIMYESSDRFDICGHVAPQADDIAAINALYP